MKYKRILLKLSGEVLAGEKGFGFDDKVILKICEGIKKVHDLGVEIGIVVGGGNFWRGRTRGDMDRVTADHIGMLGTVMNSLALKDVFIHLGVDAVVQTAIDMNKIAEPYSKDSAVAHLKNKKIVIFGCGTGNPFFTTDSAAALRAAETSCDVFFKATNVDGVFDKDPAKHINAKKYDTLTFSKILKNDLKVMDAAAASICNEENVPVIVFNLSNPENIYKAVIGENIGTIVTVN